MIVLKLLKAPRVQINFLIFSLFVLNSYAGTFYSGSNGEIVSVDKIISSAQPGQVWIISEAHGHRHHHDNQIQMLEKLGKKVGKIHLGLEFLSFTKQQAVDQFQQGRISEDQFLKDVSWGKILFDFYRTQFFIPIKNNGWTWGINMPRSITNKIAEKGLESLSDEEKALIPPHFSIGKDSYFERFQSVMRDHVPENKIKNYFVAHSLWDETMAWKTQQIVALNPEHLFVIIVGDFHLAYLDGLVSRLNVRGISYIVSLSQIDTTGFEFKERMEQILPHPKYGQRADYIFDAKENQ